MRLLIVVDGWYPGFGGAERQVELLSQVLSADCEVEVWAPLLDRRLRDGNPDWTIPLHHISYPRIRVLGGLILGLKFALRLLRQRRRFDAIHVHMVKNLATVLGLLSPWLPATTAAKFSGAWEFDRGVLDPAMRKWPWIRLMNLCIRRLDVFQAISLETRDKLLAADYPAARIAMIPNAVDTNRFSPAAQDRPGGRALAIYSGRLTAVKGVRHLIEAWGILDRHLGDRAPRLKLVGKGPLASELEARVKGLGLSEKVEFTGAIDDVESHLRQATMYVQPSLQEGLPNAVLEAMACGLPVVAAGVGGNVELVKSGRNGYLVAPDDAEALAHAVRRLHELPAAERAQMGRRARSFVERNYCLQRVVDQLLNAYRGGKAK